MTSQQEYEAELTGTREEIATMLQGVVDGLTAGSIRLGDGAEAVSVEAPETLTLEVELESEDDGLSLELELEWPDDGDEGPAVSDTEGVPGDEDEAPVLAGVPDGSGTLARFELFRDRGDEWRWRLRHRNGNIIATSGEGYTQKHNAKKGLGSVVANAPDAEVSEAFDE